MEAVRSKRDPRTAAELEQVFPGRMWVIARKAAEHGWDLAIHPTDDGWALYLTEDHHCIHIYWKPNHRSNRDQYPWDLVRNSLATRCPNGGRAHMKDLNHYLANHPDECLPTHTRAPIVDLPMPECSAHLPTPGHNRGKRDPLDAPIIATVDVVDVAQQAIAVYGEEGARAVLPPDVEFRFNDYRFELPGRAGAVTSFQRGATADDIATHVAREIKQAEERGWTPGEPFNPGTGIVAGYVAGTCGHRVARSEWAAGLTSCERCPAS